jgi:uncharacterized protein (TIGR04222 family)
MTTGYPFPGFTGPEFLLFYSGLTGIAVLLAFLLRERLRATGNDLPVRGLNSLELAYLAGGKERAVAAVAVGFLSAGAATMAVGDRLLAIASEGVVLPPELEPLRLCARGMIRYEDFRERVLPWLEPIHARLVALGLCPAPNPLARYRLAVLTILAIPVVIGLVRAGVGAERGRPVGYLVILLLLTIFVGLKLSSGPHRTRAGTQTIEESIQKHSRAARAPLTEELAFAFALAGPAILAGTPLAGFKMLSRRRGAADGGGGGGCGGGGGGGGGCGG